MATHRTTDQPGANDNQNNSQESRNHDAHDTGGNRPNMEQVLSPENKSKQGIEDNHDTEGKTKEELKEKRGGHGHSGHGGNRNESRN